MNQVKVFTQKPQNFEHNFEVAGSLIEHQGKFLFLQKSEKQDEAGCWGVPGGKLQSGENAEEAALRELFEETGIANHLIDELRKTQTFFVIKPHVQFVYHLFHSRIDHLADVILSDEHQAFSWLNPKEVDKTLLVSGAKEAFDFIKFLGQRPTAHVNAYLVLKKDDQTLLMLRKNTGYKDGEYGLISGHVESNESAIDGLIREANEEAGIIIHREDIHCMHVMHRRNVRYNVDFFFTCDRFSGEVQNMEPHKCEEIAFFTTFPENTIDYVKEALLCIERGITYSEWGWSYETNLCV